MNITIFIIFKILLFIKTILFSYNLFYILKLTFINYFSKNILVLQVQI